MMARKMVIAAQSYKYNITASSNWIRMIIYHHVFDDERKDFTRQIKYLKNFGEFISLDQLCELVDGENKIDGRYFCMSFDDGIQNTHSNMMDITESHDIPVIIYLPTNYIGKKHFTDEDTLKISKTLKKNPRRLKYLSWSECIEMLDHQVTFGSHTTSHTILSTLNEDDIESELIISKQTIEEKLGIPCIHFAVPNGIIGKHFDPELTKKIAIKLGYKTLASSNRGKIQKGDDLYLLNREHLLAGWENFQIKYFFGKD